MVTSVFHERVFFRPSHIHAGASAVGLPTNPDGCAFAPRPDGDKRRAASAVGHHQTTRTTPCC
jgi:hypothetical protein